MTPHDQGPVAIVTGGCGDIGRAIARVLHHDSVRVLAFDLDPALPVVSPRSTALPVPLPSGALGYRLDVVDQDQVVTAIDGVIAAYGRIDILVNNAGISGPARPIWETSIEYWHRIFDVHAHGTFYMMRQAIPHMIDRGYGRVVNVASVAGKEGNINSSAYSSAKAAVLAMTKSAGKELATTGVLVNAVAPGLIETALGEQVTPSHRELLRSKIPMGRGGRPEEVAEMVRFLASDRCTFSTGAVFDVSGGRASY
ncbi:SDR family NAD(P)-dependent oxidoreductase [Prauserella flavalba]|uniref:SDR family NAD(P)-dependent oxidoreductase n=1 Tax=Prauserella flavalba TaxID=1477506 RepID=UPI0036DFAA6E